MSSDEIGGREDHEPLLSRRAQAGVAVVALVLLALVAVPRLVGSTSSPPGAQPSPTPSAGRPSELPAAAEPDPARIGFIGLPPTGSLPSAPQGGRLEVAVSTPEARVWVYADGRLITLRYEDRPEGADPDSTGLLEQQLTLAGVERLRSYVAQSAGRLGDPPARPVTGPADPLVRVEGRLRVVEQPAAACDARSCPKVTDPGSWLPPEAWRRERLRAYVPSMFAVCYGLRGSSGSLRDAPTVPDASLFGRTVGGDDRLPADWPCSVVSTQRATHIVAALRGARVLRDSSVGSRILAYVIDVRSPRPGTPPREARLFFEPLLPDERWPCSACA